jgi:hypothetical protein
MVKIGDNICYIRKIYERLDNGEGTPSLAYDLVVDRITSVAERKSGVKLYSKRFAPFDFEDVASNTKMLRECPNIILVQEPFLDVDNLKKRAENWILLRGWEHQEEEWLNGRD